MRRGNLITPIGVVRGLTGFLVGGEERATCYTGVSRNNRYSFSRSFSCARAASASLATRESSSTSVHVRPSCRVDRTRPTCSTVRVIYKSVRNVVASWVPSQSLLSKQCVSPRRVIVLVRVSEIEKALRSTSIAQPCTAKVGNCALLVESVFG